MSSSSSSSADGGAGSLSASLAGLVVAPSPPPSSAAAAAPALLNSSPLLVDPEVNDDAEPLEDDALDALRDEIFSIIRTISDPEHPHTIEQLGVVSKVGVSVARADDQELVDVEFKPTVPHCSLATLIGLCVRTKILLALPHIKFRIHIQPGTHQTEHEINKQLNDKERATAALENPTLRDTVQRLIKETRAYE